MGRLLALRPGRQPKVLGAMAPVFAGDSCIPSSATSNGLASSRYPCNPFRRSSPLCLFRHSDLERITHKKRLSQRKPAQFSRQQWHGAPIRYCGSWQGRCDEAALNRVAERRAIGRLIKQTTCVETETRTGLLISPFVRSTWRHTEMRWTSDQFSTLLVQLLSLGRNEVPKQLSNRISPVAPYRCLDLRPFTDSARRSVCTEPAPNPPAFAGEPFLGQNLVLLPHSRGRSGGISK